MEETGSGKERKETASRSARRSVRTDLCEELCTGAPPLPGIVKSVSEQNGVRTVRVEVTDGEGAALLGRPVGTYLTLHVGKAWLMEEEEKRDAAGAVAAGLLSLLRKVSPAKGAALVVGLGNPCLASDAVGPFTVREITVTRHLKDAMPALFDALGGIAVAALSPGVVGQTGIETAELVRGAVGTVRPALVVAVDALAARDPERLACTVQLSDTGIRPGSGVGNHRAAIDRSLLGVPVIAVGVPTVIDADTLVLGALERAGIAEPIPETFFPEGGNFFVSLKECDAAVGAVSSLLANAIDLALKRFAEE